MTDNSDVIQTRNQQSFVIVIENNSHFSVSGQKKGSESFHSCHSQTARVEFVLSQVPLIESLTSQEL